MNFVSLESSFVSLNSEIVSTDFKSVSPTIFFKIMEIDYYRLQANISTFLVSGLLPILVSYGVGEATGNVIVTCLSYVIVLGVCLWNERFISKFLTKNPSQGSEGVEEIGSDSENA